MSAEYRGCSASASQPVTSLENTAIIGIGFGLLFAPFLILPWVYENRQRLWIKGVGGLIGLYYVGLFVLFVTEPCVMNCG